MLICCVMVGDYCGMGATYINNLYRSVQRNITVDHEFVCFTDNPEGIQCKTEHIDGKGWFAKLHLFTKFTEGRIVFLDLDTLIVGNLDFLAEYQGKFAILRDFYRKDGYGSGIMLWEGGFGHNITKDFIAEGEPDIVGGDQTYIERKIENADLLQDLFHNKIVSYKAHAEHGIPTDSSIICFHGFPRPHQIGGWVDNYWNDFAAADIAIVANTNLDEVKANVLENCKRDIPRIDFVDTHERQAVLVGGGASLKDTIGEILWRRDKGDLIVSMNGSAKFLNEHGVVPDIHIIIDSRKTNIKFLDAEVKRVFMASQCDPSLFDKALSVTMFHMNTEGLAEYVPDQKAHLISSGSTVGLAAMALVYILGYRSIHLHGYDSSYEEGHHAYQQTENDQDKIIDVVVNNQPFRSTPWMIKQCQQFQELASQLVEDNVLITVAGKGLLPYIAKCMSSTGDRK